MEGRQVMNISATLTEVERRLRSLSPERLRVANDFLAYLQERKELEPKNGSQKSQTIQ